MPAVQDIRREAEPAQGDPPLPANDASGEGFVLVTRLGGGARPGPVVMQRLGRGSWLVSLQEDALMVKKGQLEVSKMDSPRQGEERDPKAEKIQRKGGSGSGRRGRGRAEGAGSKG
jgi:hypothetical protein